MKYHFLILRINKNKSPSKKLQNALLIHFFFLIYKLDLIDKQNKAKNMHLFILFYVFLSSKFFTEMLICTNINQLFEGQKHNFDD